MLPATPRRLAITSLRNSPRCGEFDASWGLRAKAGFGLALFGGAFSGTPNVGFEVNLDAVRSEPANDNEAEHGVRLRSLIRW